MTQLATPIEPAEAIAEIETYGFFSDLVVTASDQRMDAVVPTVTVTMTDAVPAATVTIGVLAIAPHHLHERVCFRHRNRIGADRWESGRRGHTGPANEDRGKNVAHLVTPFGPADL